MMFYADEVNEKIEYADTKIAANVRVSGDVMLALAIKAFYLIALQLAHIADRLDMLIAQKRD